MICRVFDTLPWAGGTIPVLLNAVNKLVSSLIIIIIDSKGYQLEIRPPPIVVTATTLNHITIPVLSIGRLTIYAGVLCSAERANYVQHNKLEKLSLGSFCCF